jgi:hypothetical protein
MSDIKLFRIANDLEAALEQFTKIAARLAPEVTRERATME